MVVVRHHCKSIDEEDPDEGWKSGRDFVEVEVLLLEIYVTHDIPEVEVLWVGFESDSKDCSLEERSQVRLEVQMELDAVLLEDFGCNGVSDRVKEVLGDLPLVLRQLEVVSVSFSGFSFSSSLIFPVRRRSTRLLPVEVQYHCTMMRRSPSVASAEPRRHTLEE